MYPHIFIDQSVLDLEHCLDKGTYHYAMLPYANFKNYFVIVYCKNLVLTIM